MPGPTFKRPLSGPTRSRRGGESCGGNCVAAPGDTAMLALLGGESYEGVSLTSDQMRKLADFYAFDRGFVARQIAFAQAHRARAQHDAQKKNDELRKQPGFLAAYDSHKLHPVPADLTDKEIAQLKDFSQAGSARDLFREIRTDGLRLMGYLSGFLQPGQDPVQLVHELCREAGYDTGSTGMSDSDTADSDGDDEFTDIHASDFDDGNYDADAATPNLDGG